MFHRAGSAAGNLGGALCVVVVLAGLGGCAASAAQQAPPTLAATTVSDPAIEAAAAELDGYLRTAFPSTYAGIVTDSEAHRLVVYRRADPALDAAAKARAQGVALTLRDARYSRADMESYAKRIIDDVPYWRGRGVDVRGAGPTADGSGVQVMTVQGSSADQQALAQRYPDMTVLVRKDEPALVPPGQRLTLPPHPASSRVVRS
jgi:hypothetical protein